MATDRFMVWVPTGRAINPITNTNWEGTGVSPHIATSREVALDVAYKDALEKLSKGSEDDQMKAFYQWPIAELNVKTNPVALDAKILKTFAGSYGPRKVTFDDGKLFYQRDNGPTYELVPYTSNEFILKGLDSFRIRFLSEGKKVTTLQGLYSDGRTDRNTKNKG